jgi:hypothetical protein
VRRTPEEISAKVREVYDAVCVSSTPISELSLRTTELLSRREWESADIERVSSEVMTLLIRHGWNRSGA